MRNQVWTSVLAVVALSLGSATLSADIVSFREGFADPFGSGVYTGSEDTMLVRNPNGDGSRHNFGARPIMQVGHVPFGSGFFDRHGLVRFDVTSLAGRFKSIDSVTLRLFVSDNDGGLLGRDVSGRGTVAVFQFADANSEWEEGTGDFFDSDFPVTPGMTTWDQEIEGGTAWAGSPGAGTPGVDFLTPVLASRRFDEADESLLEGRSFDLVLNDLSLIERWITGENAGLFIDTLDSSVNNSISFYTNNAPSPTFFPELIVEFTPIPEPSTVTLLPLFTLSAASLRRREVNGLKTVV